MVVQENKMQENALKGGMCTTQNGGTRNKNNNYDIGRNI